jgi:hypothetical protein
MVRRGDFRRDWRLFRKLAAGSMLIGRAAASANATNSANQERPVQPTTQHLFSLCISYLNGFFLWTGECRIRSRS